MRKLKLQMQMTVAGFAGELLKLNLIDELNLFVNPMAIGNGLKLFDTDSKLQLVQSASFGSGVIFNRYKPVYGSNVVCRRTITVSVPDITCVDYTIYESENQTDGRMACFLLYFAYHD